MTILGWFKIYHKSLNKMQHIRNRVCNINLVRSKIYLFSVISNQNKKRFHDKQYHIIMAYSCFTGTMSRLCVGCGGQIHDQYILRVAPNLEWHAACLKCCECKKFLDESCTCFVREGRIFCKDDYLR